MPDLETECPVNTPLSTEKLFKEFKPEYAGTWVTVSAITFNSRGGTPAQQSVKGARSMELNVKDGELTNPTRNGYKFLGWYCEDENGIEKLEDDNFDSSKAGAYWDEEAGEMKYVDYATLGIEEPDPSAETKTFQYTDTRGWDEVWVCTYDADGNAVGAEWPGVPMTYVSTDGESGNKLYKADIDVNAKINARAYIRYYDANGKLRVFYNEYKKNTSYGRCMCSYNQVESLALPKVKPKTDE